ncbi:MAG TPA: hypothetical protein VJB90_00095 [Candidatus Nanoarchaeia archaeon]|nr:hypothetical protein [Candidatus Nanoarchaeia archaeon]
MASSFREALGFLDNIGVYDVVLPFILVFVIVFAILEKTRVFGVYTYPDGKEYPKKNLDSMVAFCIAFFVIASSQLVEAITKISANMVIILMATVLFLMLAGSFHREDPKGFFLEGGYKTAFMALVGIGLVVIFLDALKVDENTTWLQQVEQWLGQFSSSSTIASVILIIFTIGIIIFATTGGGPVKANDKN